MANEVQPRCRRKSTRFPSRETGHGRIYPAAKTLDSLCGGLRAQADAVEDGAVNPKRRGAKRKAPEPPSGRPDGEGSGSSSGDDSSSDSGSGSSSGSGSESSENAKPVQFRSYTPRDKALKENIVDSMQFVRKDLEWLDAEIRALETKSMSTEAEKLSIAPRTPNWDLKRDIRERLNRLDHLTKKAIHAMLSEKKLQEQAQGSSSGDGSGSSSGDDSDSSGSSSGEED